MKKPIRSIILKRMKRPGFYGVIQTLGSKLPLNTALLNEKQVQSFRNRGFKITIKTLR